MTAPIILIDTREQLPYTFPPDWPTISRALATADYSVLGHAQHIAIERKSESDLLGCIFTDRFARECERLAAIPQAFLAIESTPARLARNRRYQGNVAAVIGKLQSLQLRQGIGVLWLEDRATAQAYCAGLLDKYWRGVLKRAKAC